MKKILFTTLALILIPSLLFAPIYALMIYTASTDIKDYSQDIPGQWEAFQYYHENQRIACNEEQWMTVTFEEGSIVIDGTILPPVNTSFTWLGGTSLSYADAGSSTTFYLSFDSHNNLKITVDGTSYMILLRRNGG